MMMDMGNKRHMMARLAAAVSGLSVILAGISRLVGHSLGLEISGYMTFATVAILFAIYFRIGGWADEGKK